MATDLSVAITILQQLGGHRFQAMTGARQFTGSGRVSTFRLTSGLAKHRINAIRITLNDLDLYDVEALRVRSRGVDTVASRSCVHVENLRGVFTALTGLDTHL